MKHWKLCVKSGSLLIALLVFLSCEEEKEPATSPENQLEISGLAEPFQLGTDSCIFYLSDYFIDAKEVEYALPPGLKGSRKGDSLVLYPDTNSVLPTAFLFPFSVRGEPYDLLFRSSRKEKVSISYEPKTSKPLEVKVKGEFNSWNPDELVLKKQGKRYSGSFWAAPGTYQYKMVVNGVERSHPSNPDSVSNGMGAYNAVIQVGDDASECPELHGVEHSDTAIAWKLKGETDYQFAFWQNRSLQIRKGSQGTYRVRIPGNAVGQKRTYIRVYAGSSACDAGHLLMPLEYGIPVDKPAQLERTDHQGMILYNVFMDRFSNGDTTNDNPLQNDSVLPIANWHGGDLLGLIGKVQTGYFDSLGVNSIWMSPIVKNVSGAYGYWPEPATKFSAYHGYWPVSFTQIDPHFGNSVHLEELVDMAHNRRMNVLLDFVANHVHEEHWLYQKHPEWATKLKLPDGSLNLERWDTYRLSTWFDTFLPSLKLADPELYSLLSDSASWWIDRYGLDGFRHDATKHIPHVFWRDLTEKLKKQTVPNGESPLYQIGETYGSRELVGSYVHLGELDAQFDFNLYDDAVAVFALNESFDRLKEGLDKSLKYFGAHHLMGNISGNQDRARFISYADGSIDPSENSKVAGWTRSIEIQDSAAFSRLEMLFAFNMFIPGVPVIYYGDEIGMPGGNDPDNRRMMRFDSLSQRELDLRARVGDLARIRHSSMALQFGQTKSTVLADGEVLLIERSFFGEHYILVLNKGTTAYQPGKGLLKGYKPLNDSDSGKPIAPSSYRIYRN